MIARWEIAAWVVIGMLILLAIMQSGCTTRDVVPDAFMIGQGVGSKADGTYLYLTWSIPQP